MSEKCGTTKIELSEEEMKLIPIPNEVNTFIVKEAVALILEDNNLGFLLLDNYEFNKGLYFFLNRWLT